MCADANKVVRWMLSICPLYTPSIGSHPASRCAALSVPMTTGTALALSWQTLLTSRVLALGDLSRGLLGLGTYLYFPSLCPPLWNYQTLQCRRSIFPHSSFVYSYSVRPPCLYNLICCPDVEDTECLDVTVFTGSTLWSWHWALIHWYCM